MSEYTLEELKNEKAYILEDIRVQAGCEGGKLPPAKKLCEELSASIHALDEKTGCHLMDSWRREELQNWMQDACEASIQEALRKRPAPPGMQMM